MAKISIRDLRHSYVAKPTREDDWALKRISLECRDGGAYALLGPSGCGKTTLLSLISGLLRPTEGRIFFDERDVTEATPEKRNIAQVFQFPVIYDTMSIHDNLAFPLRNRGIEKPEVERRVGEIARLLELDKVLDRRAAGLTADGKQKISLGRGLVRTDVNVIMFDEPLTVIDPHLKWELRSKLKELHHRTRRTMIYVTHDQTEALTFAEQVVVMKDGLIVQIGTPVELFERPRHTFVGHFIGSPGMNVLPCEIKSGQAFIGEHAVKTVEGKTKRGKTFRAWCQARIRELYRHRTSGRCDQGFGCWTFPHRRDEACASYNQAAGSGRIRRSLLPRHMSISIQPTHKSMKRGG